MRRNERFIVQVGALTLYLSLVTQARTIYVDANAPADFSTIQAAVDDANTGDTIIIRPGLYVGDGNRDVGFKGKAMTVRGTDPNDPNIVMRTLIDCGGDPNHPHRGFQFVAGEDPNTRIEGLTIQNGWSHGGGGILCLGGSPVISRCVIRQNRAEPYRSRGRVDTSNPTNGCGGGIYAGDGSQLQITHCVIEDNVGVCGGGVYSGEASDVGVACCTICRNEATSAGGGLYSGTMRQQTGGTISGCTISGNRAPSGGGIACSRNRPLIANCLIVGNWATIEPSVIWESRDGGGGVYCFQNNPHFTNCTIVNNRANASGGGIDCPDGEGNIVVENSIVWGNSALYGNQMAMMCCLCVVGCQDIKMRYCCIESGSNSTCVELDPSVVDRPVDLIASHSKDENPRFADPGHWDPNGTPNDPNDDFWVDGDYHLKSQAGRWDPSSLKWVLDAVTSPCIDVGDPNTPVGLEPQPNGNRINMGAYGGTAEASKSFP
jgi:hypothetical protein